MVELGDGETVKSMRREECSDETDRWSVYSRPCGNGLALCNLFM